MKKVFEEELTPLIEEMSELQSAKVLSGNFDLKIARQNYFMSKQDTVRASVVFFYIVYTYLLLNVLYYLLL